MVHPARNPLVPPCLKLHHEPQVTCSAPERAKLSTGTTQSWTPDPTNLLACTHTITLVRNPPPVCGRTAPQRVTAAPTGLCHIVCRIETGLGIGCDPCLLGVVEAYVADPLTPTWATAWSKALRSIVHSSATRNAATRFSSANACAFWDAASAAACAADTSSFARCVAASSAASSCIRNI